MAQRLPGLNPVKTLTTDRRRTPDTRLPQKAVPFSKARPKSRNFSSLRLSAMASQSQDQKKHSPLDALINGSRKDEVSEAIRSSMSNCLSETNLHLTVPGLKSKTRGKVITFRVVLGFLVCCFFRLLSKFIRDWCCVEHKD
ncbi:hypothetical protein BT93_L4158 [Corymbia citriodora subsp. variegata]|uniref:Uncharacterized protein n=1 Tax=Corymbia citriodora subsp. variegata TaxID=360336 RepID=A0A8T0CID8_CORYI|nr:hypothetical protein BT93_L4158 [Corymbia citriodora subsp. variegata]